MAKLTKKGLLGSLGDLRCFVDANGNQVSEKGGPTKIRVLTDVNYARLRQRMADFGACSTFGGDYRRSIREYKYLFRSDIDTYLNSRLLAIIKHDTLNLTGKKTIDIKANGSILEACELGPKPLNDFILLDFPVSVNLHRSKVKASIPFFYPDNSILFPEKSKLYNMFMCVSVVSKYQYNTVRKQREYIDFQNYGSCFSTSTDILKKMDGFPESEMVIDLGFEPTENQALIVCFGIEFFEMEGKYPRLVRGQHAIKIVKTC